MGDEHVGGVAELRHFSSDGVDIAFIDVKPQGRDLNEPILLIHGFASNHRMNWVGPRWVETLTQAGRRVIAFDNRGHGQSEKLHAPADYHLDLMTRDAANLLAHLGVERADVMGYSMGARIASFLALASRASCARSSSAAWAIGWCATADCRRRSPKPWRRRRSTASSIRRSACSAASPSRRRATAPRLPPASAARARNLTLEEAARINQPTLVAVGERDTLAGDPSKLVALLPRAEALYRFPAAITISRSATRRSRPGRLIFLRAGRERLRRSAPSTKVLITKQVTSELRNVKTAAVGRP